MAIVKSVLFGSNGSYNILGMPITFKPGSTGKISNEIFISRIARRILSTQTGAVIMLQYAHMFVHELGHALACRLLTGVIPKVNIYRPFGGSCNYPDRYYSHSSPWQKSVVNLAGPMAGVAFSTCQLVAGAALRYYITWPVAAVLIAGGVFGMTGELMSAYVSATSRKCADFGDIRDDGGNTHLALASLALVAQCALGVFAAIKLRG